MSHFTVLVIGQNPEGQLLPFDENREMDPYVRYTKAELIAKGRKNIEDYKNGTYAKYLADKEKYAKGCKNDAHLKYLEEEFPKKLDWTDEEIYAYEVSDYSGDEIGADGQVFSTYNPNSKWDWYTLGGRWTGFFKLKVLNLLGPTAVYDAFIGFSAAEMENFVTMQKEDPIKFDKVATKYGAPTSGLLKVKVKELIDNAETAIYPEHEIGSPGLMTEGAKEGWADAAMKKDIDFQGMRDATAEEASKTWHQINDILKQHPEVISWEKIRDDVHADDIEAAREAYRNQPGVKATNDITWELSPWLEPCEVVMARAAANAISTFAVVKDGEWFEKGKMGWWGMVDDEKDQDVWNKQYKDLLDSLPNDTLISVYDCHI